MKNISRISNNQFARALAFSALVLSTSSVMATPPEVSSVAKDPTEVPPAISRKSPAEVTFNLRIKEVLTDLDGSGNMSWIWTINDTVPGPMLRVMEGDRVTINVINDSNNIDKHNIDFHAALIPGGGATPAATPIPDETKSFTFTATRQGAYAYHGAAGKAGYGLFGLIVVEPKGGLPAVDKEFYIGQYEWYHNKSTSGEDIALGLPSGTLMVDRKQALTEIPNFYSFNGDKNALAPTGVYGDAIHATQGETVRFFFVNGGPNKGANWHVIGTIFDKTYQGHFSDGLRNQETEYVAPGAATVFELEASVPGDYKLVDHAIFRASNGALGIMHVDPGSKKPHRGKRHH